MQLLYILLYACYIYHIESTTHIELGHEQEQGAEEVAEAGDHQDEHGARGHDLAVPGVAEVLLHHPYQVGRGHAEEHQQEHHDGLGEKLGMPVETRRLRLVGHLAHECGEGARDESECEHCGSAGAARRLLHPVLVVAVVMVVVIVPVAMSAVLVAVAVAVIVGL